MNTVKFQLLDTPSRSKGWGRYSVSQSDRKVIESTTGNHWVSSSKEGAAEAGSIIELTAQVMLRVGKGYTAREEIKSQIIRLIVEDGATHEIYFRPGSQGIRIGITGARLAITPATPAEIAEQIAADDFDAGQDISDLRN